MISKRISHLERLAILPKMVKKSKNGGKTVKWLAHLGKLFQNAKN